MTNPSASPTPPQRSFLRDWFDRLNTTPLGDLVRGHWTRTLDTRRMIVAAKLPDIVQAAVVRAVEESQPSLRRRDWFVLAIVFFGAPLLVVAGWVIVRSRRRSRLAARMAKLLDHLHALRPTVGDDAAKLVAAIAEFSNRWAKPTAGIETTLVNSSLPEMLRETVRQIVAGSRVRPHRAPQLAAILTRHFTQQIETGVSADVLVVQWSDVKQRQPWLAFGEPNLILGHALPTELAILVTTVVRRTRLWRREQADVARELLAHFLDGLAAGQPANRLATTFGSPGVAAKLIRRSKLRNRPLVWRAARRTAQSTALLLVVVIVWWSLLLIRFQFRQPTITRDFVGEMDQRSLAVPEADRAWPLYREALVKLDLSVLRDSSKWKGTDWHIQHDAFRHGPNGEHWPLVREHLSRNDVSLQLVRAAAAKPRFGFVFRDRTNTEFLETYRGSYDRFDASTRSLLTGVLLPHVQELRNLQRLLFADIHRTLADRDQPALTADLRALLALAGHVGELGFVMADLSSFAYLASCEMAIFDVLTTAPDLFSDADLRELAHRLAVFRGGGPLKIHIDEDRQFAADFLQQLYSDDGRGGGTLTAPGAALVLAKNWYDPVRPDQLASLWGQLRFQLIGSGLSGVVASRAEMQEVLDQYCALRSREQTRPLWEQDFDQDAESHTFLKRLDELSFTRLKYKLLLSYLQPQTELNRVIEISVTTETATLRRDATLVVIALELFHRRHGRWPEALTELCPDLLPEVPLDRFDGKPLRYRLVDGQPVVYSVGRNRVDDGGQPPTKRQPGEPGWKANDGDWRLWPMWEWDL
ncbi:MAG: hypothetical protein HZA46_19260 [Planctomycetales bacterium]|nr:hypothetical protein [Planctomycetales bacterium]